jgi:hypothetical protein
MLEILHAGYDHDIIKAFLPMESKKIIATRPKSGQKDGVRRRTGGENNGSRGLNRELGSKTNELKFALDASALFLGARLLLNHRLPLRWLFEKSIRKRVVLPD